MSLNIAGRLAKLRSLAVDPAATEGERNNATKAILRLIADHPELARAATEAAKKAPAVAERIEAATRRVAGRAAERAAQRATEHGQSMLDRLVSELDATIDRALDGIFGSGTTNNQTKRKATMKRKKKDLTDAETLADALFDDCDIKQTKAGAVKLTITIDEDAVIALVRAHDDADEDEDEWAEKTRAIGSFFAEMLCDAIELDDEAIEDDEDNDDE